MGGNASDLRRKAEAAVREAREAGVTGRDLDVLQARADAAYANELSQTGSSGQAGYRPGR